MSKEKLVWIFNEWAKQYAANPKEFSEILGDDGAPVEDYGECCALYFLKLSKEAK